METFLSNIFASLVAAVALIFGTSLISRQARWLLIGIFSRLMDIDIDYVYSNKKAVSSDLDHELKRSRHIAILTSRGNEVQRDTFKDLFLQKQQFANRKIRFLLPETELEPLEYDWVQQREDELVQFDPAFGSGLLSEQIKVNTNYLTNHLSVNHIELRRFNFPHFGRIIITERFVFYTPYRDDIHGRDCKVYKFGRRGDMYRNLSRLFEQYWDASDYESKLDNSEGTINDVVIS